MKTYTSPGGVTVPPNENAVQQLMARAASSPDHPAALYSDAGAFVVVTTKEFSETVAELAAGLIAAGVNKGDRVALHSGTRIEFTYFDYAIWAAGAVTTTIYETSSPEQVRWILSDSGAVALISEDDSTLAAFDEISSEVPGCRGVFVIQDGAVQALKSLATDESRAEAHRRMAEIGHDDLASLVYTSGTTGMPKGCVLTHHNLVWEVTNLRGSLPDLISEGNRTLMFLPLAHIFARVVQSACLSYGVTIAYSSAIGNLVEEMPRVKPTWVFSVPRVFEKIYDGAKARAEAGGRGRIFARATDTAIAYSQGIERGKVAVGTKLAHSAFDKVVYNKIRGVFGGECRYAISGGAPLGARLGHFFRGIGMVALEGYGLTESTAAATVNRPDAIRVGTVGLPLQGGSIRITEDSEVLIKGDHVFSGYWNNEKATREAFTEGWFRSGDLGVLDNEGFLSITGRKKEVIVTASGKNVAPAFLEDRVRRHQLVSQVMVIGDAKPYISALITIDEEVLPEWANDRGRGDLPMPELLQDQDLHRAIQIAIDDANEAVSHAEAIKTFRILPADLTIDGGELTPTLKVKRSVVASKYASLIEDIYR